MQLESVLLGPLNERVQVPFLCQTQGQLAGEKLCTRRNSSSPVGHIEVVGSLSVMIITKQLLEIVQIGPQCGIPLQERLLFTRCEIKRNHECAVKHDA